MHTHLKTRFSLVERNEIVNLSQAGLWTTEGKPGLDYLINERKLTQPIIKKFNLGYIPKEINHQLAGRIILPIYDASNNLIAVSSRRIVESDNALPKYWHESYEKQFHLYGLNVAKETMRKTGWCILTEGQMDVLQLHKFGVTNAIAVCGVNLSRMQLANILRYCDKIIVIFDKEENKSGEKGIYKILSQKILDMPAGEAYNYKIKPVYFDNETGKMDVDLFLRTYGLQPLKTKIQKVKKELDDILC